MGNCLKTQLKSEVDNDNLIYLNDISIKANAGDRKIWFQLQAYTATPITFHKGTGKFLYADFSEIGTVYTPQTLYMQTVGVDATTDCEILIPIDNVKGITYDSINKLALSSLYKLEEIVRYSDALSKLPSNVIRIRTASSIVNTDISEITCLPNLEELECEQSEGVTGDILTLGHCTNIKGLYLRGSSISGTWESFVASQVYSNRKSVNSISINNASNGSITFKDSTSTQGNLSWETNEESGITTIKIGSSTEDIRVTGDGLYEVVQNT